MAGTSIYTVEYNGKVFDVEGPEGATPEQVQAFVEQSGQGGAEQPQVEQSAQQQGEVQFADEAPAQPVSRMSAEDEAQITSMIRSGADAAQVQAFANSKGFQFPNADEVIAAYTKNGQINPNAVYELPKVETTTGGALARGAAQGATLGFSDELQGVAGGVRSALSGEGFGKGYNSAVDEARANFGADEEDHYLASLGGNLAGGLVLPVGLERLGITASTRAVGIAARDAALSAGLPAATANRAAARAVAQRLAAEGAAYGSAYGAGTAQGGSSERLVGAAEGAVAGAATGAAVPAVGKVVGKIANTGISAANATADIVRNAIGSITKEGAADRAANSLRSAALRPIDEIVRDIAAREASASGAKPTLAEVANDPGLAGLQRGQANTDTVTGPAIGLRQQENALARTRAVTGALDEGVAPQAVQDYAASELARGEAETVAQQAERQAAVDARLATLRQNADAEASTAQQGVVDRRAAVGPAVDREATGAATREAFGTAYNAARQRSRAAYQVPVLTKPQPIEIPRDVFMRVREDADAFYGDGGGEIPGALQSIISDMADPQATTRTLTNIDRRLADFAGEAKMQGRRAEAAFAESVRGNLNDFVQRAAPADYRAALANAKSVRAEQGRVFETGDAPKAFANDRYGNPVVGDTTVPSRIVRPGPPGGDTADGLIAAVGTETAEAAVRQELRRAVEDGAVTTPAQARSLAVKFSEVARRFPGVQSDLEALQTAAQRFDVAQQSQTAAARAKPTPEEAAAIAENSALHDSILRSPLGKMADTAVDPSSFVVGLLRRSDDGRQLRVLANQVANQPKPLSGLRRAFGDYIETAGAGPNFTASGDRVPSINKTRAAIDTVVKRAGPALTNQQKIVLKSVSRELERANFAATASKPAGSETGINRSFVELMDTVPFVPGSATSMVSKVLAVFSNGEEVRRLITQSILDPDFAATLLKRPTPKHWQQVQDGLLARKAASTARTASTPTETPERRTGTR